MISVFFLVFFVSIASSNPPGNGMQTKLTESINHFSTYLFKVISQDNKHASKNLVISAMSAHIMLALLTLGAKGKTLQEMNDVLHLPNSEFTKDAYKPTIDKMNSFQKVTFHLANKAYVAEGMNYALAPDYKNYATHLFSSEVENIDFSQNTASAKINSWIEDKTNRTIKEVVKASDLDSETALLLVNAIYFKGAWNNQFNPNYTSETSFLVSATNDIPIQMMRQLCETKYGENAKLDVKILELAFEGNEMSMVFILPNKVDGLAALEKKLTDDYANFQALVGLQLHTVSVYLPKYKIETTVILNDALTKLGMSTMFSDDAELGDLLVKPFPLKVSKFIQKAFIEVNEEGGTASAATAGMTENLKQIPWLPYLKVFIADHPFYYALVNSDGQTVFSGHFTGGN